MILQALTHDSPSEGPKEKRERWIKGMNDIICLTAEVKMKAWLLSIMGALPVLLFFLLLLSCSCQKDFLNELQSWNYREGADKVNIHGINSVTRMLEKWGNGIFWQMKHSLLSHPNTLLPEFSSFHPISAALDDLVRQVRSMKKRLEELNERLNVMSRTLSPVRYNALRGQRLRSVQLRRLPFQRRRMYIRRRAPWKQPSSTKK
ncbi:uncharacterized protein LOC142007323 isoform X1 [Carettochelys insculpta]|uniref:uncharacterized protein LOC142007323 isoform X1 n=1 Tax=Carettochelys insculpta TaxID=44489 RepID=UPI003EBD3B49